MSSDAAKPMAPASCPFCRSGLDADGAYCRTCGAAVVARSREEPGPVGPLDDDLGGTRRLAVTRRAYDDQPLQVWRSGPDPRRAPEEPDAKAADEPGITLDPIKIGPDTCSGCDDKAIFVTGGQAYVYLLEGCDDDWCFYENPRGIA